MAQRKSYVFMRMQRVGSVSFALVQMDRYSFCLFQLDGREDGEKTFDIVVVLLCLAFGRNVIFRVHPFKWKIRT